MIRQSALRAATLVVFGGFVAGCTETGFQDMIGAGKYTPDETKVAVNQPLSAPPDLQLRPPSDEPPPRVAEVPSPSQPQAAQQQPASGDLQQPQDFALSPQNEPVAPQSRSPSEAQNQLQQQASVGEPEDIYARWGVSRYHPDGREKSQIELNAEMREKKLEAKRQQDPDYGTIWNLGSIWSDG